MLYFNSISILSNLWNFIRCCMSVFHFASLILHIHVSMRFGHYIVTGSLFLYWMKANLSMVKQAHSQRLYLYRNSNLVFDYSHANFMMTVLLFIWIYLFKRRNCLKRIVYKSNWVAHLWEPLTLLSSAINFL